MAPKKHQFERKCAICKRKHSSDRLLGPLICSAAISVHFKCVSYSPSPLYKSDLDDAGVAGVTTDFIMAEAARADQLICNFCKKKGANTGCCFDIGNDDQLKFCKKKYHVDCGMIAMATFSVSNGRGAVSVCLEHQDHMERANEFHLLNKMLAAEGAHEHDSSSDSMNVSLYDVGSDVNVPADGTQISISDDNVPADGTQISISDDNVPADGTQISISGDNVPADGSLDPLEIKEEDSFNLAMMQTSLDNVSTDSDCVVTAAYYVDFNDENAELVTLDIEIQQKDETDTA